LVPTKTKKTPQDQGVFFANIKFLTQEEGSQIPCIMHQPTVVADVAMLANARRWRRIVKMVHSAMVEQMPKYPGRWLSLVSFLGVMGTPYLIVDISTLALGFEAPALHDEDRIYI
jgi:hypothetical protein